MIISLISPFNLTMHIYIHRYVDTYIHWSQDLLSINICFGELRWTECL